MAQPPRGSGPRYAPDPTGAAPPAGGVAVPQMPSRPPVGGTDDAVGADALAALPGLEGVDAVDAEELVGPLERVAEPGQDPLDADDVVAAGVELHDRGDGAAAEGERSEVLGDRRRRVPSAGVPAVPSPAPRRWGGRRRRRGRGLGRRWRRRSWCVVVVVVARRRSSSTSDRRRGRRAVVDDLGLGRDARDERGGGDEHVAIRVRRLRVHTPRKRSTGTQHGRGH